MAYFEGVGGSGGSIVVTCDSEFAGSTISCSDGTNTMTAVCPSVSPYEVEFMVSDSGTYEISATVSGTTYTTEVVVDLELEAALEYGFSWPRWVTYGGLDPSDYEDLADVFSDEAAVRRLMTIHASADYLIDCVTNKLNDIDAFCANDTAMKWIGLRDYVCDGLTAITGVEAKFLASEYWERYLKDHVPVMTSASAPYGTVIKSSDATNYEGYRAFDDTSKFWQGQTPTNQYVGYGFVTPCVIKKFSVKANNSGSVIRVKNFKLQACNDSSFSNAVDLGTYLQAENSDTQYYECNNDTPYNFYRIFVQDTYGSSNYVSIDRLQFYGRSLDVSVPVMTSDTTPYGTVFYDYPSPDSSEPLWRVFDNNDSTNGTLPLNTYTSDNVGYQFTSKVKIKKAYLVLSSSTYSRLKTVQVKYSNDGTTFYDATDEINVTSNKMTIPIEVDEEAQYWEMVFVRNETNKVGVYELQFYGVDYSEKEFETGTTKKWLYDHGVELETLDKYKGTNTTSALVYNDGNSLAFDALTASNDANTNFNVVGKTIDLSSYSLLRAKVGNTYLGKSDDPASGQKVFNTNGIPSSGTYSNSNVIASVIMGGTISNPNTDLVIDLSAINENKWISIGIFYYRNLKMAITEWWLE